MIESKVYKGYQTTIPREIRKQLDIHLEDQLKWYIEDDEIILEIKKQRNLNDYKDFII